MNKTVYIVDDDPLLLEGLEIALGEHAFTSTGFESGKSFWKQIQQTKPDAVILDIGLDGESGDRIATRMKNSSQFRDVPVILISAENGLAQKAKNSRANAFLAKPFPIERLIQVVDESVSSRNE